MADAKDKHLSGLYRQFSREEPPAALDRAVMELARKSLRRRTLAPFGNHRVAAGALAGICIVSVLLVVLLPEQTDVLDLPLSLQEAEVPALEQREEIIHLKSAADEAVGGMPGGAQDGDVARERFDFYSVLPEAQREAPAMEPVIAPAAPTPPPLQAGRAVSYVLQIDGFSSLAEASAMQDKLTFMRLDSRILQAAGEGMQPGYRIHVGPYMDLNELDRVQAQLDKRGIKTTREREP